MLLWSPGDQLLYHRVRPLYRTRAPRMQRNVTKHRLKFHKIQNGTSLLIQDATINLRVWYVSPPQHTTDRWDTQVPPAYVCRCDLHIFLLPSLPINIQTSKGRNFLVTLLLSRRWICSKCILHHCNGIQGILHTSNSSLALITRHSKFGPGSSCGENLYVNCNGLQNRSDPPLLVVKAVDMHRIISNRQ